MSSRNASRLDPGLIARKGEAAPASLSHAATGAAAQVQAGPANVEAPREEPKAGPYPARAQAPARGLHGTIAVTVRLDPARYERLKVHGARLRLTNQEIFVEALDGYFRNVAE